VLTEVLTPRESSVSPKKLYTSTGELKSTVVG
jgi:hypothetical protein